MEISTIENVNTLNNNKKINNNTNINEIFLESSPILHELHNIHEDSGIVNDDVNNQLIWSVCSSQPMTTDLQIMEFEDTLNEMYRGKCEMDDEVLNIEDFEDLLDENSGRKIISCPSEHFEMLDETAIKLLQNPPPLTKEWQFRSPALPIQTRSTPKYTLVLDLDETLVHCSLIPLSEAALTFSIEIDGLTYKVYVRIRPYFKEFLERLSQTFEIILFTASKKIYADALCDILDPEKKYIRHRLFREHCVYTENVYIKDLNILGRDLSRTVIVDNSLLSFAYQIDNGIPIKSWYEQKSDCELLNLIPFLEEIIQRDADVRPMIREKFRIYDYLNN
uniref:CTD small phosphatase-like protein 2 (inferred by orthology to a human protein) n=1 Tax=Strongyloides venezuelensis TaxID=75913 RepID=A0A0K0FHI8_STRVS